MNTEQKPVVYKKEIDTKSVKIFKETHRKLKIHVAKTGENITEFVSDAIDKKLSK